MVLGERDPSSTGEYCQRAFGIPVLHYFYQLFHRRQLRVLTHSVRILIFEYQI